MNEIAFHREGDYLLPDLLPPEPPHIGVWGQRRERYLRQYHEGVYTGLVFSGKLSTHLEEIDISANELYDRLIKQHAVRKGITEQLKATGQMAWVMHLNSIRDQVEGIINAELILARF